MSEPEATQQRIIFSILDKIADGWPEEAKAWVNKTFYPEYYEIIGRGDDAHIENVELAWQ